MYLITGIRKLFELIHESGRLHEKPLQGLEDGLPAIHEIVAQLGILEGGSFADGNAFHQSDEEMALSSSEVIEGDPDHIALFPEQYLNESVMGTDLGVPTIQLYPFSPDPYRLSWDDNCTAQSTTRHVERRPLDFASPTTQVLGKPYRVTMDECHYRQSSIENRSSIDSSSFVTSLRAN